MYLQEAASLPIYNHMEKKRYSFTIDSKLYDALDTYCSENGFNRSLFIEFLLKDFVAHQKGKDL